MYGGYGDVMNTLIAPSVAASRPPRAKSTGPRRARRAVLAVVALLTQLQRPAL